MLRSRVAYLFTKRFGAGGGAGRPKPAMATLYGMDKGYGRKGELSAMVVYDRPMSIEHHVDEVRLQAM